MATLQKKKQMAPTTSIAHGLQYHATCTCTDCSPLNHIAQVLLCSDFLNVKDTQLVWGHKKRLTLKLITRLALKCKVSALDWKMTFSFWFRPIFKDELSAKCDFPLTCLACQELFSSWWPGGLDSFGETTQAEVKTLVKKLVGQYLETNFPENQHISYPPALLRVHHFPAWDMDSYPRGYIIPQPGMNFTTNKLQVQWMIGWKPTITYHLWFWKLEGHHIGGGKDLGG